MTEQEVVEMTVKEKLEALRAGMKDAGMDAYIVPSDDFHSSEYVGEYFKEREYMSGFTGSAGTLVVLLERAALWTDGRYFKQAKEQLKDSTIELMRAGQPGVPTISKFLAEVLHEDSTIGFDGRTVSKAFVDSLLAKSKFSIRDDLDLVGEIWSDRPEMSKEPVWEPNESCVGYCREEKMEKLRAALREEKVEGILLSALDEIAWLLNLRGNDVAYTPVFLAYMLVTVDLAILFVNEAIISEDIREKLEKAGVEFRAYESIASYLETKLKVKSILLDSKKVSYRLQNSIPKGIKIVEKNSPIELMKAIKTPAEMDGMREAHRKDGVAVTRFMRWLKEQVATKTVTEISAAKKLLSFREEMDGFLDQSFSPIIAYGEHGAIVHYEATAQSNATLEARGLCLADTGAHYREGTTDITRTIALGPLTEEEKKMYTIVLRGHLNLGAARFLEGLCGQNLDYLARGPLWEYGLDYNHGTGHGVGFLLSVHEGPQRIHWKIQKESAPVVLREGMIISNEPGLYLEGKFGIRHENLVLCRKCEENEYGQFMYFEPLTMVPFDRDAIVPELLSDRELDLLNSYHEKVYETLAPLMSDEEVSWLKKATEKIKK